MNDWYVRHARRLLQERAAAGTLETDTVSLLGRIANGHPDITRNLRGLWAMHAVGAADAAALVRLLTHDNEHMRWWGVKLLSESKEFTAAHRELFVKRAREDESGLVRLGLASALQRLAVNDRWELAEGLASRASDAKDPNLPFMIWYGIEPGVGMPENTERAIQLMTASKIPVVREFIARRLAGLPASPSDKTACHSPAARSP